MLEIDMTHPFMLTCTGREHPLAGHPVHLDENAPRIEEIAHALAQINRFTGHAVRPYSVAEHSLLVCDIVASQGLSVHAQMAALLHDAHEAYTGDVSTPIKHALGAQWHRFEQIHEAMVQRAFCIRTAAAAFRQSIKRADLIALATERRDLMPRIDGSAPWAVIDTPGAEVQPLADTHLMAEHRTACTWHRHLDNFLARFHTLDKARLGAWHAHAAAAPTPLTTDPTA